MSTVRATLMPRDPADERDLSFVPVNNLSPKRLTLAQIAQFNERGYISPLPVFSPAEASANRAYFDRLLAAVLATHDGRDAYSINGYHKQCTGIYDIVTNPTILDYVEDLLGPNIVAWGTHYFCKQPHDPRPVPWHQDASYWPLTPSRTVTVWLAIDDTDSANSAMQVVPGTHVLGHLKWEQTAKRGAVLGQEIVGIEAYGKPKYIELQAGQIEMHADMLVHGSDPNPSDRRRCGLTIRYASTEVRALKGWNQNSIMCRGRDAAQHWANNPRPPEDSAEMMAWQRPRAATK
jgi:non-haem Fe2+, alpha-ketoglutarate-dependent halogenase